MNNPFPTSHLPLRFAEPLTDEQRIELMLLVTQALEHVEAIAHAAPVIRADVHNRTIKAKADAYRPYTLKDAKPRARAAASILRKAWDMVDPPLCGPIVSRETNDPEEPRFDPNHRHDD